MKPEKIDHKYSETVNEMFNTLLEIKRLISMKRFYHDHLTDRGRENVDSALQAFTNNLHYLCKKLIEYETP